MSDRFCLSSVFLLALSICSVGAEVYKIDSEHSNVSFSIRYLVSNTGGDFHVFSGNINFDEERPEEIQIKAIIQANSIDTDNVKRDEHLRSDDFFNVEKHPILSFTSSKAELKKGEDNTTDIMSDVLYVQGEFSMHGVSKMITLPVHFLGKNVHPYKNKEVIGFSAKTVILRSDFGINNWTDKAGVLSDEVNIELTVQAIQTSE
jgi:polyisoprenoid-binding protein YceI